MVLKRDKYDIEVQNDDELKLNQTIFYLMQQTLNCLDGLYFHEQIF